MGRGCQNFPTPKGRGMRPLFSYPPVRSVRTGPQPHRKRQQEGKPPESCELRIQQLGKFPHDVSGLSKYDLLDADFGCAEICGLGGRSARLLVRRRALKFASLRWL